LPDGKLVDATFNLPYRASWITANEHPAISLEASWPEGAPISGTIKKDVHLETKDGKETVDVRYVFSPGGQERERKPSPTFVTAFSVPAVADGPDRTQLCWFASHLPDNDAPNSQAPGAASNPSAIPAARFSTKPVDAGHCSPFVVGGAILVPAEAKRIEVRTVNQPTLAMEWDAGRLTIEQKQFSARLLLELPVAGATGSDGGFRVRYTILREP
jgi:hypothetical protein